MTVVPEMLKALFISASPSSSPISSQTLQFLKIPPKFFYNQQQRSLGSRKMGLSSSSSTSISRAHYNIHKLFLLCNYILLGAASSCIFLTLSLRLVPSVCGFFIIFLHAFTIAGAVSGCAMASASSGRWFGVHMVFTVLTAIFQGSVTVLIFTRTGDFLGELKSYVREEDGAVILKLGGGLSGLIFCLEWIILVLAFCLKYYLYVEGGNGSSEKRSAKVQQFEDSSWATAAPFPV